MMSKKNNRFIFTLPAEQAMLIKRIAYLDDSSAAEVIRVAIEKYTKQRKESLTEGEMIKEFWGQAERKDNSCLEWQGRLNKSGYGAYRPIKGETTTHRISYAVSYGDIPEGLCVCHKCDNPKCIDPKHLFIGTHEENFLDMRNKNRQNITGKKLNGELAAKIINMYYGSYGLKSRHLANKFGVGLNTISRILTRKSWENSPEVIEAWKNVEKRRERDRQFLDDYIRKEKQSD